MKLFALTVHKASRSGLVPAAAHHIDVLVTDMRVALGPLSGSLENRTWRIRFSR